MEVPPLIKRRYIDIEKYLDGLLLNYKKYPKVDVKGHFIQYVCNNMSIWFVREYSYNKDNHDMGEQVNEFRKYFIYAFRTKISIFWEQW